MGFAADNSRSLRRLKLPATQCHFCLTSSRCRFREKLQRKGLSSRTAISISVQSLYDSWCLNFMRWLISYTWLPIYLCYDRCARVFAPLRHTLMLPRADSRTPATLHEGWSHQTHGARRKMCTSRSCRGHPEHLGKGRGGWGNSLIHYI